MSDSVEVKKETLTLERIALMAVVCLISWNVYTTNQLSISQAVLTAQLESIKSTLTLQSTSFAPKGDILVLQGAIDSQGGRFENWIGRIGDRVNTMEDNIERLEAATQAIEDALDDIEDLKP